MSERLVYRFQILYALNASKCNATLFTLRLEKSDHVAQQFWLVNPRDLLPVLLLNKGWKSRQKAAATSGHGRWPCSCWTRSTELAKDSQIQNSVYNPALRDKHRSCARCQARSQARCHSRRRFRLCQPVRNSGGHTQPPSEHICSAQPSCSHSSTVHGIVPVQPRPVISSPHG